MVERHGALVGEEDVPLGELRGILGGAVAGVKEGFCQDSWQRAAGDSQPEVSMAVQGLVLATEEVGSEFAGEGVEAGKAIELGGGASHGEGWWGLEV